MVIIWLWERLRSSRSDVFCKKSVLRNFTKFTGQHLCQNLCFHNFIIIETLAQVFSCEFCKISKNTCSYRTPQVATSENYLVQNYTQHLFNLKIGPLIANAPIFQISYELFPKVTFSFRIKIKEITARFHSNHCYEENSQSHWKERFEFNNLKLHCLSHYFSNLFHCSRYHSNSTEVGQH